MKKVLASALLGLISLGLMACEQSDIDTSPVVLSPSSLDIEPTVELGSVKWNRDLKAAQELAARSGKPLFVQFQEVPG